VTLVLGAYSSVTWEVILDPKTKLEKVILAGHRRQAVTGLAKDVEVVEAFGAGRAQPAVTIGYQSDTAQFRMTIRQLHKLTGMNISSFHGAYQYRHDAP